MRSGGSALGVMAGVLLGLGVVALAGSGLNLYTMQASSVRTSSNQTYGTSTQSVTTTNANGTQAAFSGTDTTPKSMAGAAPLSQVKSIAGQPIALTGFVLLPIFAAFLFGFVLYRVSRMYDEGEERSEAA